MTDVKGVVRLYRSMDENDSKLLTSKDTDILSIHSMNGEIISVFDRTFWFNRMALDDILLKDKMLVNPATKRCHTVVGLTNYSQRTASGWASSLNEVMLQVNGLELKDLSNMSGYISAEETEQLLREYYIQEVPASNIMEFRSLVKNTFDIVNLKRKCLLDLVNGDSWYRVA